MITPWIVYNPCMSGTYMLHTDSCRRALLCILHLLLKLNPSTSIAVTEALVF